MTPPAPIPPELREVETPTAATERLFLFKPGDKVYVYGRPQHPWRVLKRFLWRGFPHYTVIDKKPRKPLLVPQLHMSTTKI